MHVHIHTYTVAPLRGHTRLMGVQITLPAATRELLVHMGAATMPGESKKDILIGLEEPAISLGGWTGTE